MPDNYIPRIARRRASGSGVVTRKSDGVVTRILCKGCGKVVAGPTKNGLIRAPDYTEVRMYFRGGTNHVTHSCMECASKLVLSQDAKEMDRWYAIDIQDWIDSIETTGLGAISKTDAKRRPIRVEVEYM